MAAAITSLLVGWSCVDPDGGAPADLAVDSAEIDLIAAPDAPRPDTIPPDGPVSDQPCTCIPISAWKGWKQKYCDCFSFNWGCKERPKKWSWCDVHLNCMYEDTDPATGCPRPQFKTTGCTPCFGNPNDQGPPDQPVR